MTETHNANYKFKEHILKLSQNKNNYDVARTEWIQMPELYKKLQTGYRKCICQHKLKYYYIINNKKTHNNITVGKECYKKFGFNNINTNINEIYKDIINNYFQGEYDHIDDVNNFSINIEVLIEQDLKDRYDKNKKNINELNKLKDVIIELFEDYNFTCLEELKNLIIETINELKEKERIKKEKEEEERIKKEKEEERFKKEKEYKKKCKETDGRFIFSLGL